MRKCRLLSLLACTLGFFAACGGGGHSIGSTVSISASSTKITLGQSVMLSWTSKNVTSCTASANPTETDWSGSLPTNGSQSVTPSSAETTTYTLQCSGTGSATSNVTVGVSHGFTSTGSMTTGRGFHTATLLSDGKVLIAGGEDPLTPSAELFDPANGTFTSTGNMGFATRVEHRAILLNDGRVLVAGGHTDRFTCDLSAELFDPASATFSATGNMTEFRCGHTATLLNDGKVLVTGGREPHNVFFSSAELYDPTNGTFASAGSMGFKRSGHTATLLNDGRVLLLGGLMGEPSWQPPSCLIPPVEPSRQPAAWESHDPGTLRRCSMTDECW